jgi:CheY-like chemotaxis protein
MISEPTPSPTRLRARVLVVDDHPGMAATLARALSQLGASIEVISATSAKSALEQVRDGAVDLLITDMMMPEMNGLELIERLRQHPGGQPTFNILITAYDVPGLKESARRLKVNEIIIKPFRPERIVEIVRQALASMSSPDRNGRRRRPACLTRSWWRTILRTTCPCWRAICKTKATRSSPPRTGWKP